MPFVASVETPIEALRSKRATRVGSTDAGNPPVLQSRAGRPPERLARALDNLHPAAVFVVVMLAGLAVIAALSIGLGFFVTRVLEQVSAIANADDHVNTWLAAHRTPGRTHASLIGSILAGGAQ